MKTYPFDIHGFISSGNSEDDLVADLAAMSVIKFGWERSRLLVIFLSISELLQKLTQIFDAPVKRDSIVFSRVGRLEKSPNVFLGIGDLLGDGELLNFSKSSSEFSVLLGDTLGVLSIVLITSSWTDLE